jgi:hypothetical protein
MPSPLVTAVQRRVAVISIGPSTARGKGNAGVVAAAHQFLGALPLARFSVADGGAFRAELDSATEELLSRFRERARFWALARKCLNIFLCDAFCNLYLHNTYGLAVAEPHFEVPPDSNVAKDLRGRNRQALPPWRGVKHLTPEVSDRYQAVALDLARTMGCPACTWTPSCSWMAAPARARRCRSCGRVRPPRGLSKVTPPRRRAEVRGLHLFRHPVPW